MWKGWSPSRKLAAVVLLVVVVVAGAAIASSNNDGSSASARTGDSSSTSSRTGGAGQTGGGSSSTGSGGSDGSDASAGSDGAPPASLPATAEVTGTTGLHAGDEVTINVKADKGSVIYGVEMRMCREGSVIRNDGDMLPTVTGQCASKPLSPGADGYKIVPSQAPHDEVTATYKVGTGTDTYQLDDATTNSVTCDSKHPCVLAVKYQIPNGFTFRTYQLTFAP